MEPTSTDKRIDDLSDRVGRFEESVDRRFDKVDRRFEQIDRRFDRFEDKVDERFARVDKQFTKVDGQIKGLATKEELAKIDARLDNWGKVVSGGVVAIAGGVILRLLGI